ncbi:MAG: hypothetical protein JSS68_01865 [Actinobacteria bacterium]|nr:hypothetical protein [Actinomycetota bacterium]MBS1884799.1 hypothetical protein [Actinomycetota bacterium]
MQGASAMAERCETPGAVAIEGMSLEHLTAVGGPRSPLPLAALRIRERDLVICDGAGLVHYLLRFGAGSAGWEQRTLSYPPLAGLRAIRRHPDWPRWARRLCLGSPEARSCRVAVGVVAAEARAAEEVGDLHDGEGSVLRLSEAAAAILQGSGREAAKAGRLLMDDVDRARRPSHVPLFRLQAALAEELALGHLPAALCSRSPGFSDCADESKVVSLLCRRLGLQGTRDSHGRLRYARVAGAEVATLLCEALDLPPGQVGL